MKVNVDIEGLERKIAVCHEKIFSVSYDEEEQYWAGRCDAYVEVLCNYLGVSDPIEKTELEDKIIEKYRKETRQ